jgi:hypothetical protein
MFVTSIVARNKVHVEKNKNVYICISYNNFSWYNFIIFMSDKKL